MAKSIGKAYKTAKAPAKDNKQGDKAPAKAPAKDNDNK